MKFFYEKPEVEYIDLFIDEVILNVGDYSEGTGDGEDDIYGD